MADVEDRAPSLEEVVDAARTLNMVRRHVSGFGRLEISEAYKRNRGRVLEARLCLGGSNHARYVKPELGEIVQPAADVLTQALNSNYWLNLDTSDRNHIVVSIKV